MTAGSGDMTAGSEAACATPPRTGYFGPEGTYTQEAMLADTAGQAIDAVALPTIYDTIMAVHDGAVERALVPIENSMEGSVNATLDTLAIETDEVRIVGEVVLPIRHCLIARTDLPLDAIETVVSHPQANAQCARFIRTRLPHARVLAGSSTADAVRTVAGHDGPWAALGNRLAAEHYGCRVLLAGVEDHPDNETRFVWLARCEPGAMGASASSGSLTGDRDRPGSPCDLDHPADPAGSPGSPGAGDSPGPAGAPTGSSDPPGTFKTAIVFWGAGSEAPGWLVGCLSAFAERSVNLTRIESRPRKQGLGRYMFFLDLEGHEHDPDVAAGLTALSQRVAHLRVLGCFPAA